MAPCISLFESVLRNTRFQNQNMEKIKFLTKYNSNLSSPALRSRRALPHRCRPCTSAQASKTPKKAAYPPKYLTYPLISDITELLAAEESAPPPLWGSFAGTITGMWVGTTAAFAPFTGQPEPIALASDGKTKLLEMSQCCVEERVIEGDRDSVVRHTSRAATVTELEKEMKAGGDLRFDATASMDSWDSESLCLGQDGLFIFDGGSYSSGPVSLYAHTPPPASSVGAGQEVEDCDSEDFLEIDNEDMYTAASGCDTNGNELQNEVTLHEEEEEEDAEDALFREWLAEAEAEEEEEEEVEVIEERGDPPKQTSFIEACLQWNGEQRVRVRIALTCSMAYEQDGTEESSPPPPSPELDVSLLRVSVCREGWEGMPGRYTSAVQPMEERVAQSASSEERLRPEDLFGFWNEFELSVMTVEDVDMRTGLKAMLPMYSSREVQKIVRSGEDDNLGGETHGDNNCGMDGGALWLPHRVVVQLTMTGDGRFEVSVLWSPEKDLLLWMKRQYKSEGTLDHVVHVTGIKAK